MNDILINKDNPFLDHLKWNELANTNIFFDKILTSMFGGKYKGTYDEDRLYDKYDYIWKDDNLYFVSNKPESVKFETKNIKGINKPIIVENKNVYGINKDGNFVQLGTNSEVLLNTTQIDNFSFFDNSNIAVLKNGNRLIKSNGSKTYGLNFLYQEPITEFKYDGMYLYILTVDKIVYGDISSPDNTSYYDIELNNTGLSFDVSNSYIAYMDIDSNIVVLNKQDNSVFDDMKIEYDLDKSNAKIKILNNNFLILYDGISKIYKYHINKSDKTINLVQCYSSEFTKNMSNLNTVGEYISFTNNNILYYTDKFSNVLVKSDIKNLLIENSVIKPLYLREGIDFSNGEIQSDLFSVSNMVNMTTRLNKGLLFGETNSSLKIKLNDIIDKTIMLSFKSINNKTINLNISLYIGGVKFETTYSQETKTSERIKFLINLYPGYPEVFVNDKYYDGTYVSTENVNTEIIITGSFIELDQLVCFDKMLQKDEIDFVINNTIALNVHETTKDTPYSTVKTNSDGNAMIQTGTLSTKGILKISNDTSSPSADKAFSTIGASNHLERIKAIESSIKNDVSPIDHKHKFNELLEIPIANSLNPGIVKLTTTIDNKDNIAATPIMVKKAYDLANHTHPYLNINTGGIVSGNLSLNGTTSINYADVKSSYVKSLIVDSENVNKGNITTLNSSNITSTNITGTTMNTTYLFLNGYKITVG